MPLQGITNPIMVDVKHPFLIIENYKLNDSIFHIYDLASYELKSVFGVRGEGPGEFMVPQLLHTPLSDLLIQDNNRIHRFGISEEGLSVFKDAKQLCYIYDVYGAAFINDSIYVMDAIYTAPSVHLLRVQDELPRKSWTYRNPDIFDYYIDPDMGNVFANESRIVFCYGYKKQIDFMDTEFNLIKRVKFEFAKPIPVNSENEGDVKVSYVYSYLGSRYLYTLFFGTSWNDHRARSTLGTILEVYDLDGNPVARYQLDGRRPVYFAVDEETFTLYGAGEEGDPEDYLLVYTLKGLSS
ncbi:MAG: TolB-like 6-bladed beta-propeller domain-containing protein [Tannerellaceae bacterium]|jgi:hypothetical protein|nr:TolB-like 6-bladed beta-propeller domain-containing protein [Tannerellaceae bacterium]